MSLKKFDEYMNAKGNVEKPKVSTSGDNVTGMDGPNYKKPKLHENPYVVKGAKNARKWNFKKFENFYPPTKFSRKKTH